MRILGISASPRQGQGSFLALLAALEAARQAVPGLETSLVELADKDINGCLACGHCAKGLACSQSDDFPGLLGELTAPGLAGLILATPVYFGGMTSQAKAFLDRAVILRRNGFRLRDRVGGVIAVGGFRNGGQELAIQGIHAAMLTQDMIIVGDGMPTSHFGGTCFSGGPGGMAVDEFGLTTARGLGRRVSELAAKIWG